MGLFDILRKRGSAATQPQERQPVTDNAATDNQEIAPSNTQFDMDAKQLEQMEKWCLDFELHAKPELVTIEKYRDQLPPELMAVWERYGFGSILNGYLRFINPDDYQQVLNDTWFLYNVSIPIFTTAFGDIGIWKDNKRLFLLQYTKKDFCAITGGMRYFWKGLDEDYIQKNYFHLDKYDEAIKLYGKPGFDECFGYFPILGAGGKEDVKNLQIVKIREHIFLISQMLGGIGM